MPKKPIEAKPTIYNGVKYKSRLEARWAVFFDSTSLVPNWRYEPKTFHLKDKGWDYTPDFVFTFGGFFMHLEVKPVVPTAEYIKVLDQFSDIMPLPLMLGVGDFYKGLGKKSKRFGQCPAVYLMKDTTTQSRIISECLPLFEYFQGSEEAVQVAKGYRFDLPPPKKQRKFTKGPTEHFREYRQKEVRKSREKSKQIDWKEVERRKKKKKKKKKDG